MDREIIFENVYSETRKFILICNSPDAIWPEYAPAWRADVRLLKESFHSSYFILFHVLNFI